MIGDPEGDSLALLGRLIEKIRRSLSLKHIERDEREGLSIVDRTVRARIEWDQDADGRAPLLVIDGQNVAWEQLGRMLMTFEGFQFKLEIRDKSEEI